MTRVVRRSYGPFCRNLRHTSARISANDSAFPILLRAKRGDGEGS